MESILPIAAFAERTQLSRRTIERKIAIGEIGADYVQRHGRRVFIDAAVSALSALAVQIDGSGNQMARLQERFRREEAAALASLMGRPPFRQVREVVRRVQADGSVDFDTNHYSVP